MKSGESPLSDGSGAVRFPRTVALFVVVLLCSASGFSATSQPQDAASSRPAFTLDGEAAIVTLAVKADRVADFERLIERLQDALSRSQNPARRAQAAGWEVFRAVEAVAGNVAFVMRLDPVVRGQDYDVVRLLAEQFPAEAAALGRDYQQSVMTRSSLALNRVAIEGLGGPMPAPGAAVATPGVVPALSFRDVDAVAVTTLIRQGNTADFESVLGLMAKSLEVSNRPVRRKQASGLRAYRATQLFDNSVPYVVYVDPVAAGEEYDPIRLIQEAFPNQVDDSFKRYRGAFVGQAISRLVNRRTMNR